MPFYDRQEKGRSITIKDEGLPIATNVSSLDFVGSGVTGAAIGSEVTETITSGGGSGDVIGPAGAVDSNFASFDTATGKLIKDSGSKASDFATAAQGSKADTAVQPAELSSYVPTLRTVNAKALSSDVVLTAADVGAQEVETAKLKYSRDVTVRVATTANITLSNTQTIDGVALSAGDYVLVKNQSSAPTNGVYVVVSGGAWTRATEFSTTDDFNKRDVFVTSGTVGTGTWWLSATKNVTVGTTNVSFAQIPNGIGTGADQAAAGNHSHTSIATTSASSIGAALSLRYTSRTATASTATTDLVIRFSGSTAAQVETMPDGTAVANNSGRYIKYVNNATVPWTIRQAASNTLDGSASDVTLAVGAYLDVFNTADNAWVTVAKTGIGAASDLASATTIVNVSSATAPTSGQVLTATSSTAATWQTPTAGGAFSGCRLTQSAAQNISGVSLTPVTFNTETFDTDTYHDNSTNPTRITIPTTGYYMLMGVVTTDANATVWGGFRIDGSTYIHKSGIGNAGSNTANGIDMTTIYYFTAGQYVELIATFGTTQNTKFGADGTMFSVYKIG